MRSRVALALVATLFSTILGTGAANASCVQPNLPDQIARADVIAYGRVSRPAQLPLLAPARQVRFRVENVLKGVAAFEMNVAIGPDVGASGPGVSAATSVDYKADDGTAHTLYLRRTGAGAYSTDACTGSHPGAPTAEETALLGSGGLWIVTNHEPVSWALPASVAIVAVLVAGAAVVVWRRQRDRRVGMRPD